MAFCLLLISFSSVLRTELNITIGKEYQKNRTTDKRDTGRIVGVDQKVLPSLLSALQWL